MKKKETPKVELTTWGDSGLKCILIHYDKYGKVYLFPDEAHAVIENIDEINRCLEKSDFYLLNFKNKISPNLK